MEREGERGGIHERLSGTSLNAVLYGDAAWNAERCREVARGGVLVTSFVFCLLIF